MKHKRAIIIGAGIGGLATANILAKAGYSVTIYEANDQAGGRAGQLAAKGFLFDTGPSWYLMPKVFEHYFSLFGRDVSTELDLVRLKPAYKVFFEDKPPITIASNLERDSKTFDRIEPGAGAALQRYVKQGDIMYQLALERFLYSNFNSLSQFFDSDTLRHGPRMARLATMPLDRYVGQFVQDQRLKQILEYPSVFLGTSPFEAPALYSLMSALDFKEGVFYPRGGIYQIIERLVALGNDLGVTYNYSTPVRRIVSQGSHATGVRLQNGRMVHADLVISNADLHFTETSLLDEADRSYPQKYWDGKQPGPSALLCYLGVKGELPQLEHHNLFFAEAWKQNFDAIYESCNLPWPASLYICKPSATDRKVAPRGSENVFVLVPLPPGLSLSQAETDALGDLYLSQIERVTGIDDLRKRLKFKQFFGPEDFRTKYHAWQATALGPSHILRQSAFFRTPNVSKKLHNLYYVGGFTTPGVGLPMCLIGAELIYKRLVDDRSAGPLSEIMEIGDRYV